MSELKSTYERNIKALEEGIRTLRIEWDLFFCGQRRTPPTKEMEDLDTMAKKLHNTNIGDNTLRFKFASVYSNYVAMSELWKKRLRLQEEGKIKIRALRKPVPTPPPAGGVVLTGASGQNIKIKTLFQKFLDLSNPDEVKNLNFQNFSVKISQQVEAIMRKTGCQEVQLSVRVEEGKVKLKAKPLKGERE
jgi:hypothetical protein